LIGDDPYSVTLEVMSQLSRSHDDCVCDLLQLKIEDFEPERASEAKYTGICLSFPSSSSFSCTNTALTTEFDADTYSKSGDLGSGGHNLVMLDR
jgi:hypothetical protein